jgi:2-dehydropantoate 2-reductase
VVARGAHLDAMRASGVTLLHGETTIRGRVRAAARAVELGIQDFVLVTLKANLLGAFAREAAPLLGPHTAVVFVQNGIPWWYALGLSRVPAQLPDLSRLDPGSELARAVDAQRVIGAVAFSANEVDAPGVIRNLVPGRNMLVVGEPDDGLSDRIQLLRKTLDNAGMPSPPCKDIRQTIWAKLVLNLGTSILCTLTGETVGGVRGDGALSATADRLRREGQAIAAAFGVPAEGAPERPGGGQSSSVPSPSSMTKISSSSEWQCGTEPRAPGSSRSQWKPAWSERSSVASGAVVAAPQRSSSTSSTLRMFGGRSAGSP